jgi:hypothetical protein
MYYWLVVVIAHAISVRAPLLMHHHHYGVALAQSPPCMCVAIYVHAWILAMYGELIFTCLSTCAAITIYHTALTQLLHLYLPACM